MQLGDVVRIRNIPALCNSSEAYVRNISGVKAMAKVVERRVVMPDSRDQLMNELNVTPKLIELRLIDMPEAE